MEIITHDDIRRSGADNIPDILQFISGIDVRRYGFSQAEVSVRGYDQQYSPRLLVLINGRQVYLEDYGYTAWQTLPVQLGEIRQIEVVKGPNSALFGFNAVGGVINIVTYDPLADSVNAIEARGGTQNYKAGSAVTTLQAGEDAGLRLSAGTWGSDEFSTTSLPALFRPFETSPHQFALSADGRLRLASNVELTTEATLTNAVNMDAPPAQIFLTADYRTNSLKAAMTADTSYGLTNIVAYRNQLSYGVTSSLENFNLDDVLYVLQVSDLFKLGASHTIRLGIEYRDESASGVALANLRDQVYAASAMWDWKLSPTLALANSVRVDRLALGYDGAVEPGSPFSAAAYDSGEITALSFNSGLVYSASAMDTVRLLIARGVQAPSLVDLGLQTRFDNAGYVTTSLGNPTLGVASVTNYELNYDRELPFIYSVIRAAVYHQDTRNLFTSPLDVPPVPAGDGLLSVAQNIGGSNAFGGEIGLKGKMLAGGRWSVSYARVSITQNLVWDSFRASESQLDYAHGTPANVVDAALGYTAHKFEFDLQGRWQSSFTDYGPGNTGAIIPYSIDNYLTLNARIGYHFNDHLTLSLAGAQVARPQIFEAAGAPTERRIIGTIEARL